MNKDKMKAKLAELRNKAPEVFDELVSEYQRDGEEALLASLPPARKGGSRTKRTREVRVRVWAMVELLRERDGIDVLEACKRLDSHGSCSFMQYTTPDNKWRPSEEQIPEIFEYTPPDWQSIRRLYYEFDGEDRGFGRTLIRWFRRDQKWQEKYLPPRVKTQS